MSDQQTVIARVYITKDKQKYGCLTVWSSRFPGLYSIRRDKPSEKYPAIGLVDAIKAFAAGEVFVDVSIESQREKRGGGCGGGTDTF